jgi:hypothetical protein
VADVAQDRRYRGLARVDVGVDVERLHQRDERGVVDEADRHPRPHLLGTDRGEEVHLVVVRHGEDGIGALHPGLVQELHRQPVSVKHDGALERVGGALGAGAVLLDDLGAHPFGPRLERAGHGKTHVAAPDDDDPLLPLHGLAEDLDGAVHVVDMGDDVDLVVGEELVVRFGGEEAALAAHARDDGAERREEVGELAERRVEHRAVLVERDAEKLDLPVEEALRVEGGGCGEAAERGLGDLALGRDDHVDRHVVAAVEIGVDRGQVGLRAEPGDLAWHAEDRMGHLAGDHVDLVRMCGRDHHVGVARTGAFEDVGVAREARDALDVERVGRAADEIGVVVDYRDVVAFAREMARDLPADLARTADDHLHDVPWPDPRAPM